MTADQQEWSFDRNEISAKYNEILYYGLGSEEY